MNLMYKYVDFYCDIDFWCLFIIFILSYTFYEFSLINDTFSIIFCGNSNGFQYSFVTICYFCVIIINLTAVKIVFCERKCKSKITAKIYLPTSVTQWWIPKYNISTETMLDMYICQAGYHIHILPSILFMIFFTLIFPSLLRDSMPHLKQT